MSSNEALIECVPNFSEGRDSRVLDQLCETVASVPGAVLLDATRDADHNRAVLTFAGAPGPVLDAAVRVAGRAAALIDLSRHRGVHPRIGAVDVIPFVPVTGASLEDCTGLARRCAAEIWRLFQIPSYFYEAAATSPHRVGLENLRRGGFADPPDTGFGPHPTAGITAIGARKFLIAWNVHLDSTDIGAARLIARSIRESSGGFPGVKALGLPLPSLGRVQVSMNITDFERTPLHLVLGKISELADTQRVSIIGSELIGLIPARAVELSAGYDLKWLNFTPDSIFENRLSRMRASWTA